MYYTKVKNTKNTEVKTVAGQFNSNAVLGIDTSVESNENFRSDEVQIRFRKVGKKYQLLIIASNLEHPLDIVATSGNLFTQLGVLTETGILLERKDFPISVNDTVAGFKPFLTDDESFRIRRTRG